MLKVISAPKERAAKFAYFYLKKDCENKGQYFKEVWATYLEKKQERLNVSKPEISMASTTVVRSDSDTDSARSISSNGKCEFLISKPSRWQRFVKHAKWAASHILRSLPGGGVVYSIQWAAKKVCSKITGKRFELSRKEYIQDKNRQLKTEIESYIGKTTQEQKDNVMRIAKVRRRYDVAQTLCTGLGVAGLFFPPLLIPSIVGALITNVMKRAYDPGAIVHHITHNGPTGHAHSGAGVRLAKGAQAGIGGWGRVIVSGLRFFSVINPLVAACSLVASGLAQVAKKTVKKLRLNQVKQG